MQGLLRGSIPRFSKNSLIRLIDSPGGLNNIIEIEYFWRTNLIICSCIYCREIRKVKGITTHVDRIHLKSTKYSSGFNGRYKELSNMHQAKIANYLLQPNKCIQCEAGLEYSKRKNKFCCRSCSAIYNNARKDYTIIKTGPIKSRKSTNKHCGYCNILFDTFNKNQIFCNRTCSMNYKNALLREKRTAWQNYRADCQFKFNLVNYVDEFDFELIKKHGWYKAFNRGNNLNGISRDHMVSCRYGFDNNLPTEDLRHPANCKLIPHTLNSSKNINNSITYEQLLDRIKEWDKKYN